MLSAVSNSAALESNPAVRNLTTRLGPLTLSSPAILAPLAGYTDTAMRRISRRYGAALVFSEMLSGEGARRNGEKTLHMAKFESEERPYFVQFFATNPEQAADAARVLAGLNPDGLDLNFGCPVKKIILNQGGSALLKDVSLLARIVRAAVDAVDIPVSVKIRSGWDKRSLNSVEVAKAVEDSGAAWVTVHARTRSEFYEGQAHWDWIGEVKSAVRIPVVGNGDVRSAEDVAKLMKLSGCDAVMIGRAAMGYPFVFREINSLLSSGLEAPAPTPLERYEAARQQLLWMTEHRNEKRAVNEFRKHILLYVRGLHNCSSFKNRVVQLTDAAAVTDAMYDYFASLPDIPTPRPLSVIEDSPTWQ
ncbi:tRNA dihydrouridine synthase DusB [bacterium]|nr:tRNA dihydrouridine synthase DusB [bacterium]